MYALNRKEEILRSVNDEQKLPVQDYKGPSIVLAGAGAGKTRTIVARAAYMIEDGVDPSSILIFTFTKKAANEIKERILNEIGVIGGAITTGTYHSFCSRVLRHNIEKFGLWTRSFSIFDAEDSLKLIKKIKKEKYEEAVYKTKSIASCISGWKEKMINADTAVRNSRNDFSKTCAGIYQEYSKELITQNAVDFDDLIYLTIRLFEQFPETKQVINDYFKYIIADEAQDSSPRDLELITHLMGDDHNICLVGDDFQSIYGFRGSDIESFFDFVEKYDLKKFYLSQNYRSTQTIVDAAQSVIEKNPKQFKKNLFSENAYGDPITVYSVKSPNSEAQKVVQIIKALMRAGEVQSYSDIAVLYRISAQSRGVEDAFLKDSIPYHMLSGTPFYARMEIKDIMAYLRLLVNPRDKVAFARAIQTPSRGIGEKSLETINSCVFDPSNVIITTDDLIKALKPCAKGRAKKGVNDFVAVLETINTQKDVSAPKDVIQTLLNVTKYLEKLEEKEEPEDYDKRYDNIQELITLASEYQFLSDLLSDFTVSENQAELTEEADKDGVNMLTIHGSKGLEFKVVILVGCGEGGLPCIGAIMEGEVEEERRLFYVGLTRAKEKVFLTYSRRRNNKGFPVEQEESRFVNEIKDSYYNRRVIE